MTTAVSHLDRQFVIVDLENLLGCAPIQATDAHYAAAMRQLAHRVNYRTGDLMVVGVDGIHALLAHELAPNVRLVTGHGKDGADLALLGSLERPALLAERFGNVVIASGDHIFTGLATELVDAGAHVTVAAIPDQLSASLKQAASAYLPLLPPDFTWAA